MKHTSHPGIATRLKRAEGHLRALIAMLEEGRSCVELAQQLHAVEKAVGNAKRELVQDHIEHCLDEMNPKTAVREFKALAKYL
jgi:uncharacterized protein